jgi:microcystin-dependent protein
VGINTTSPDSTALLDIRYSGQGSSVGVMLPHLDAAARQQVKSRVSDGMLVFDRDEKQLYYYDGKKGEWVTATPFGAIRHENGFGDIRPQDAAVNGLNLSLGLPAGETAKAKLDVNGNARVRGNIKVEGSDTVQQNLLVKGTATLQQSLQVSGNTTLQNPTTINNTLTVTDNIDAGSNTIAAGTVNATTISATTINATNGNGVIPIGGIIMWSGTSVPSGWALCNGGTSNGYTTPDLRGRFIVGYGANGTGLPNSVWDGYTNPGNFSQKGTNIGQIGGEMRHTLSVSEMPAHNHTALYTQGVRHGDDGDDYAPISGFVKGNVLNIRKLNNNSTGDGGETNDKGGSAAHENRPPYYVLAFIMRVQ